MTEIRTTSFVFGRSTLVPLLKLFEQPSNQKQNFFASLGCFDFFGSNFLKYKMVHASTKKLESLPILDALTQPQRLGMGHEKVQI